jgi:hypothetical protein
MWRQWRAETVGAAVSSLALKVFTVGFGVAVLFITIQAVNGDALGSPARLIRTVVGRSVIGRSEYLYSPHAASEGMATVAAMLPDGDVVSSTSTRGSVPVAAPSDAAPPGGTCLAQALHASPLQLLAPRVERKDGPGHRSFDRHEEQERLLRVDGPRLDRIQLAVEGRTVVDP